MAGSSAVRLAGSLEPATMGTAFSPEFLNLFFCVTHKNLCKRVTHFTKLIICYAIPIRSHDNDITVLKSFAFPAIAFPAMLVSC